MAGFNMDGYVDVAERIKEFYAKNPTGSLRTGTPPQVLEAGGKCFVVYHAQAFRTPDDACPADGWAWEPIPGPTPYTKDSELQNAETSAWGRAIVAAGFETKKIASADEVRNRQSDSGRVDGLTANGQAPSPSRVEPDPAPNEPAFVAPATKKPTPAKLKAFVEVVNGLIADGAITAEQVGRAAGGKIAAGRPLREEEEWPVLADALNSEQVESLMTRLTTFMANLEKEKAAAAAAQTDDVPFE